MRNVEPFEDDRADRFDQREGSVARTIESQTAKLPSDLFLWIAGGAIGASITLRLFGKMDAANWIGDGRRPS